MENDYTKQERREFIRLDYATPLAYKVCKEETISKLLLGYTSNISEVGILCTIDQKVDKEDVLWFKSGDAEDLAKKIILILNNRALKEKIISGGLHAVNGFDIESSASKIADFLLGHA